MKPNEYEPETEYKKAFERLQELEQVLFESLKDDAVNMIQEYVDTSREFNSICETNAFREGFKNGVNILLECVWQQH